MIKEKFYTCRNDKTFKIMFLDKENKRLLKRLLEFILEEKVKIIRLLPTEYESKIKVKGKRLDALIEVEGKIIGIELNSKEVDGFRVKNMSYLANNYASYTLVGETYDEDMMIMQINLTYGMGNKDNKPKREYYMQDEEGKKFVKNLKIIEVNMDYFKEIWDNEVVEEIEKNKILIMLDLKEEDLKKLSKNDKVVEEYMEKINKLNKEPVFRRLMTEEEEKEKETNTIIKNSKEEGFNEGITQGIMQTAKEMLKEKFPIEQISKITKLSLDEIEKLK